ncbi:MAG: RDD family protein [Hydrogenophaga sp.]|nr:RDD family protein [Hydrogenophaga sp.]
MRRMACWLYEGLLLFGVLFAAGCVLLLAGFLLAQWIPNVEAALENRPLLMAYLFAVLGLYFTWFWAKGQTLAMKTWDIRVVDRNGRRLRPAHALLRYLLAWLWLLPPLGLGSALQLHSLDVVALTLAWIVVWALLARLHPQRQFLHDALAGTQLVHHREPIPPKHDKRSAPA